MSQGPTMTPLARVAFLAFRRRFSWEDAARAVVLALLEEQGRRAEEARTGW